MNACEHQVCNIQGIRLHGKTYGADVYIEEIVEYRKVLGVTPYARFIGRGIEDGKETEYSGSMPVARLLIIDEGQQHYTVCGERKEWANT